MHEDNNVVLKLRLHQFLSRTGAFPRKEKVFLAIKDNKITVNGKAITSTQHFVRKDARVCYEGKLLRIINKKVYYLFNKPVGCVCQKLSKSAMQRGEKSIFSSLPEEINTNNLFTIGRLDKDTSGLIIMTNDGAMSNEITQPKSEIPKLYEAQLELPLSEKDRKKLETGVTILLEDETIPHKTKRCKVNYVTETKIQLALTEGKKREVRLMLETVKNGVISLRRLAIGNLNLKDLNIPEGTYKEVDKEFIYQVFN